LSETETVAVREPVAVGVNVAAITQFAPAARLPTVRQSVPLPGVAKAKSPAFVPVRLMLLIVSVVDPALLSDDVICALVVPWR